MCLISQFFPLFHYKSHENLNWFNANENNMQTYYNFAKLHKIEDLREVNDVKHENSNKHFEHFDKQRMVTPECHKPSNLRPSQTFKTQNIDFLL